jgi:hypothetical protein
VVADGTTVLETLKHGDMEEMLSLYSVDGDSVALPHYCPTNNQPRMRATPAAGKVQQLVFEFQGAGNLPDSDIGHGTSWRSGLPTLHTLRNAWT